MKKETTKKIKDVEPIKKEDNPIMRKIIIETDGNNIHIVSADVAGKIELIGILQSLINHYNKQQE